MPSLGWQELVIVLVIVIIIFGAGKLPEIGGALGKSIKEFNNQSKTEGGELETGTGTTVSSTTTTTVPQQKVVESREVRADEI